MAQDAKGWTDDPIPLGLTRKERSLLLKEAGRALGIEEELRALPERDGRLVLSYILEDWEELAGFLTRVASKAKEPNRVKELDALIERIEDLVDQHFDHPGEDEDDGEADE